MKETVARFTENSDNDKNTLFVLPLLFEDYSVTKLDGICYINTFCKHEEFPDFDQEVFILYHVEGFPDTTALFNLHKEKTTFKRVKIFDVECKCFILFVHRVPEYLLSDLTAIKKCEYINISKETQKKILDFWEDPFIKNDMEKFFTNPFMEGDLKFIDSELQPILKDPFNNY